MTIYNEIKAERERAHAMHVAHGGSVERLSVVDHARLDVIYEEIGEVAREFNEARNNVRPIDLAALRKELIQVAAMSAAWADAIGEYWPESRGAYVGCPGSQGAAWADAIG